MKLMTAAKVTNRKHIMPGYNLLRVHAPDIAHSSQPGQFLHVLCSDTLDPLLRRPISIHTVDKDRGTVSLLYRVAGRGTAMLSDYEQLNIMGPLGNGFTLPPANSKVLVVAGGIGIAPLYFLLQKLSENGSVADVFLGASSAGHLLRIKDINELGHSVQVATDDGSSGYHGRVTDICSPDFISGLDMVYTCGPRPMMRALAKIIKKHNVPGQFSLEERMGCGVGACLACACKTRTGHPEEFTYSHVCVDGPVFSASEVVWE